MIILKKPRSFYCLCLASLILTCFFVKVEANDLKQTRVKTEIFLLESENFTTSGIKVFRTRAQAEKGQTILFIPGLLPTEEISFRFAEALLEFAECSEIYIVDPIGYGQTVVSELVKENKFSELYLRWLHEFISAFAGEFGKPLVVAHSMGCIGIGKLSSRFQELPILGIYGISPLGYFNNLLSENLLWLNYFKKPLQGLAKTFITDLPVWQEDSRNFLNALREDKKKTIQIILSQAINNKRLADGYWVTRDEFGPKVPFLFLLANHDVLGYHRQLKQAFPDQIDKPIAGDHSLHKNARAVAQKIISFLRKITVPQQTS